jgi:hypothetical protein
MDEGDCIFVYVINNRPGLRQMFKNLDPSCIFFSVYAGSTITATTYRRTCACEIVDMQRSQDDVRESIETGPRAHRATTSTQTYLRRKTT